MLTIKSEWRWTIRFVTRITLKNAVSPLNNLFNPKVNQAVKIIKSVISWFYDYIVYLQQNPLINLWSDIDLCKVGPCSLVVWMHLWMKNYHVENTSIPGTLKIMTTYPLSGPQVLMVTNHLNITSLWRRFLAVFLARFFLC